MKSWNWKRITGLVTVMAGLLFGAFAVDTEAADKAKKKAREKERFGDTTTVVAVEVPVQVIRQGDPVRGLTVDDFEILEGKKNRPILDFEAFDFSLSHRAAVEEAPEQTLSIPVTARRHFLLLFDLSFSEPADILRAREAAMEMVQETFHPADLIGVATYSISRNAELVLGFTSDRGQVYSAIETLGLANPIHQVSDPLRLAIAGLDDQPFGMQATFSAGPEGGGSEVTNILIENLEDMSALTGRATRDLQQNRVMAFSASLGSLAEMMRSVSGRKHVVLLSQGFDSSILLGTAGSTNEERRRLEEINRFAATGEYWKVDSDERYGSTSTQTGLTNMVEEFRRADCTIQAVNIGRVEAGHDTVARGQDGLFIMANETGGEMFQNFNDLSGAMGEMLERTSVTYVLTFQPDNIKLDGKFHKIKVRLKENAKGTEIVHRPGYFAPTPYEQQSAVERQLTTAGLVMGGGEGGDFDSSVLAAAFQEQFADKAYVPVLIEMDGGTLTFDHHTRTLPAEIYAYAIDSNGAVKDFFNQALALDMEKVGDAVRGTGFKFWGHFDLAPGTYVVRVVSRNGATGATSVAASALEVPPFDGTQPTLLPPLFPEPADKWLMGREKQTGDGPSQYPFMLNGEPFIPAARPTVRPGEAAPFCLLAYDLAPGDFSVTGKLVDADGNEVVGGGEVDTEPFRNQEDTGAESITGTFIVGGIAGGQYRLEVTLTDASGGELTSSVPIEISG